jgi:hypothetical protein
MLVIRKKDNNKKKKWKYKWEYDNPYVIFSFFFILLRYFPYPLQD